jgi:hypothetical protein
MHKEHTAHPRSQEQAATSPDLPLSDYGRTRCYSRCRGKPDYAGASLQDSLSSLRPPDKLIFEMRSFALPSSK